MDLQHPDTLRRIKIAAALAGVGLVVAVGLALAMRPAPAPDPDADLAAVAKFVDSSRYDRLGEAEKLSYMKRLRKDSAGVKKLYEQGALSREQYHEAVLNGWMARQLDHMEEYYSKPAGTRDQALVAEYRAKAARSAATPATRPATGGGGGAPVADEEPDDEAKDDFIGDVVRTWPPEQREKWETYRKAVKAAKSAAKGPAGRGGG